MQIEFLGGTRTQLEGVLGNISVFRDQLEQASNGRNVVQMAVHPLTPGRSGAAVFLVHRVGSSGRLTSWVVKVSKEAEQIIDERNNNKDLIAGTVTNAPTLVFAATNTLIFEFGGPLAEFNPTTLRDGYPASSAETLEVLMSRIVKGLQPIHKLYDDIVSCAERMLKTQDLAVRLRVLANVPDDARERLCAAWSSALAKPGDFPRKSASGHGDLNSGNVLFEAGVAASYPVFIDFASMRETKDSEGFQPYRHFPFWDYVKIDRDILTRMFLSEALEARMPVEEVVAVARSLNGAATSASLPSQAPVSKAVRTTAALRSAIAKAHAPHDLRAYKLALARALVTVLFRKEPDGDLPFDVQCRVAAEGAIAALSNPSTLLSSMATLASIEDRSTAPTRSESSNSLSLSWRVADVNGKYYLVVENTGSRKIVLRAQARVQKVSGFWQELAGAKYAIPWEGVRGRDVELCAGEEAALHIATTIRRQDGLWVFDLYQCTVDGNWENPFGSRPYSDTPPWAVIDLVFLTESERQTLRYRVDPSGIAEATPPSPTSPRP